MKQEVIIMKTYYNPEIEMILLSNEDVIATSMAISKTAFGFGDGIEDNNTWVW